jgi:hypothetical protein
MRRALVAVAAMLTMACNDGRAPTAPSTNGTLGVQLDPITCNAEGPFDVDVYIDHVLVGTPSLSVDSVTPFVVTGGMHTLGGIAKNGMFDWVSNDITVPAGGEYTAMFGCR